MFDNLERLLTSAEWLKAQFGEDAVQSARECLRDCISLACETLESYEAESGVKRKYKKRAREPLDAIRARYEEL